MFSILKSLLGKVDDMKEERDNVNRENRNSSKELKRNARSCNLSKECLR